MDAPFEKYPSTLKVDVDQGEPFSSRHTVPINIKKAAAGYLMEIIAPGFLKDDFKIHMEKKTLTISAEMGKKSKEVDGTYLKEEFKFRPLKRSFTLGEAIDTDNIDAKNVNGVLTLNFPRKQGVQASAKNISVE